MNVIQGKAITERMAKQLPPECQDFRKSYLKGLKLVADSPKNFSHEFAKEIETQKSFKPPYDALLIAALASNESRTSELTGAIAARAKIETTLKVKFQYAVALQEKIEKGSCSSAFQSAPYREICHANDAAYARVAKLQAAGVKR